MKNTIEPGSYDSHTDLVSVQYNDALVFKYQRSRSKINHISNHKRLRRYNNMQEISNIYYYDLRFVNNTDKLHPFEYLSTCCNYDVN